MHGGILAPLVGTSRARRGWRFSGKSRRRGSFVRQVGCKTTPGVISVAFVGNYVVRDPIRTVHVIVGPGVLLLAAMLKRGQGV